MVLKTAETKQIFVVFAEVIIHHVQIVKETSNLGLSTMDHVVSCCALLQLVLYYGIFQLEKIRRNCPHDANARSVENIESENKVK